MTIAEPATPTPPVRRRLPLALAVAAGAVVVAAVFAAGYLTASNRADPGGDDDLAAMNARAAAVMPFDLDATRHTFTKNDRGGVEEVVVDDPADRRNLDLIRDHLRHVATEFARGNFADPTTIHGADMPGLARLRDAGAAGRLEVTYEDLPTGARITYGCADPDVVVAIHDWFDAQTHDHAMPGMGG